MRWHNSPVFYWELWVFVNFRRHTLVHTHVLGFKNTRIKIFFHWVVTYRSEPTFSVRGWIVNILGFARHWVVVTVTQACLVARGQPETIHNLQFLKIKCFQVSVRILYFWTVSIQGDFYLKTFFLLHLFGINANNVEGDRAGTNAPRMGDCTGISFVFMPTTNIYDETLQAATSKMTRNTKSKFLATVLLTDGPHGSFSHSRSLNTGLSEKGDFFPERITVPSWHCGDQARHNWVLKICLEKLPCGQDTYVFCKRAADYSMKHSGDLRLDEEWETTGFVRQCCAFGVFCNFFVSSATASLYSHTHRAHAQKNFWNCPVWRKRELRCYLSRAGSDRHLIVEPVGFTA